MLTMQTASNLQTLKQYLPRCLLVLIPAYVLAASVWRLEGSPSVLAQYGKLYISVHAALMLLALLLSKKFLVRSGWWPVILLGTVVGVLATCFALPSSTAIALDDGVARVANGYRLAGWLQATAAYCLFSFYTYTWLLGASIFAAVKWLLRPTPR